jgi:biopolymer transport protein ExbD
MNASSKKRTWLWILLPIGILAVLGMIVVGLGIGACLLWGVRRERVHPLPPPAPTVRAEERARAEPPEQAAVASGQPWSESDDQRRALQAALEQAQIERAEILRHADEERAALLADNRTLAERCQDLERQLVQAGDVAAAAAEYRTLAVTVTPQGQYIHGTVAYNADGLRDLLRASASADSARTVAFTVDPRVGKAELADLVDLCRQCGVFGVRFNLTPTELLKE